MLKLVIARNDRILLGDDVMITVLHTGGRPQLAIDAPQDVRIRHVKEDYESMFRNRKSREAAEQDSGLCAE
jgi:sRNA-binding carbon storage regulator CsrA